MSAKPRRARHARAIQAPPTRARDISQALPATLRAALILVSTLCVLVSGVGWTTFGRVTGGLSSGGNFSLGADRDGATDILLVGSDSRADAEGNPLTPEEIELLRAGDEAVTNTDTIMVIRVPDDGTSATAISIPRDTYVKTPALGNIKINGVYGQSKENRQEQLAAAGEPPEEIERKSTEAGRRALIDAIADLTAITVDHYAEVGLLGFVLLTDAVGGVEVCLNAPVYDEFSGADFTAGRQTLGGADALSFVRQRHGLPRGDLDRITRQQAFMASFVNKLLSAGTLSNPARLGELGAAVRRSVVLDDEWDVMGFATQMQGLTGGNVVFDTIPVTSIDGVGDHGESVVTVDKGQVHRYFDKLLGQDAEETTSADAPEQPGVPQEDVTVSVYNATFTDGLASRVAELLRRGGFGIGDVTNAEYSGVTMSQVNAYDTADPAARRIAEQLGDLPVVHDPSLARGEVSVTLAGDYDGPGLYADEAPTEDPEPPMPAAPPGDGDVVGQEGPAPDEPVSEQIDAGGDGPMCVN
ncbi:LCP family protein [Corynebacterium sphenisci]|uniref:LCP family protein n=1 Tax=Corynebacterium sphenisci TaxID=191493 RepID=UPI0026DFC1F9|nr:LCP family protein [Corynebacterium sphenisci]MDO5730735.1 LCP family protein [Corynebacterium sphenisci]